MKNILIYADGACRGNGTENALGAYGIVLLDVENKKKKELSFACRGVTNNIMELRSVIEGLKYLKEPTNVKIYSDSAYVVNAFNQKWVINWQRNGWKTANKDPVKNRGLWEELWALTQTHKCEFIKVKGHSDNEFNNRCDKLANEVMDKYNE